jgi:hypothetical protein
LILPLDLNPAWKACLRFHPLLHFCATVSRAHIEFLLGEFSKAVNPPISSGSWRLTARIGMIGILLAQSWSKIGQAEEVSHVDRHPFRFKGHHGGGRDERTPDLAGFRDR